MDAEAMWATYVGDETALAFMSRYASTDPVVCVAEYLDDRPGVYGIVRRDSWKATFEHADQFNREAVTCALAEYLEQNRDSWETQLAGMRNAPAPEPDPDLEPEPEPTSSQEAEPDAEAAPIDPPDEAAD